MAVVDKSKLAKIKHALIAHHDSVVTHFHKKHAKVLKNIKKNTLTVAGAAIVLATAVGAVHHHHVEHGRHRQQQEMQSLTTFLDQLNGMLASRKTLVPGEEEVIAAALSKKYNLDLKVTLEGNRLNEIYGFVGKEQHLKRWSGDTLSAHDLESAGMAPRQGAFKNFDNAEQEKYYVAVQLHELPNWNKDWAKLKPWYRYRKVFVFNPVNQRGVVAVIGDAGPSKFTGKTFGGSPEIMDHLQMVDGSQKGRAIILFIDDKHNNIALGPVDASPAFLVSK